jgi:geranylgeranyl pyrophosphate synthase
MLDMPEVLSRYAERIEARLRAEVAPEPGYPFLSEPAWYAFEGGGKRLRPTLCLAATEALGGDPETAIPFAVATEIFHNVLLIHDDIEDGDTMRRDKPTLWVQAGLPNAINVSDLLICKVFQLITETPVEPAVRLELCSSFCLAFERTVEGQALDINLRGHQDVTLETYLRIVQLKTAYYLALPWVGGALIAGVPSADIAPLWELGRCLGPAFQIKDDLLDLTQGKGRGGEVGCDLKEGKPSIFFAYVLDREAGAADERRRLGEIVRQPRESTSEEDVRWAIDFYHRSGAIPFAESEAQGLIQRSSDVLEESPFSPEGKEAFRAISRYIIDRST